jgi:carboxylesterase type B
MAGSSRNNAFLILVVIAVGAVGNARGQESESVEVDTILGPVIGNRIENVDSEGEGKVHYEFRGIPYAEAPVGPLRFADPVQKESWEEPVNSTEYGNVCPQLEEETIIGDEDCLALNVYTPRIPTTKGGRTLTRSFLLPVMIWLHDSYGWVAGSGEIDPMNLVDTGIVVVSPNYRLGALGFLNLQQGGAGGNMGLKDQLEAIKWTVDNIAYFGGDPDKITLAGYGAGAAAAHLHQISPQGRNLYRSIIAQSGSALSGYVELMKNNKVQRESLRLVKNQECDDDSPIECLQGKDVEELLKTPEPEDPEATDIENAINGFGEYHFIPSVDRTSPDPFLPDHPYLSLLGGRHKDLPIITGIGSNDGSVMVGFTQEQLDGVNGNWSYYGPAYIEFIPLDDVREQDQIIANVTRKHYLGTNDIEFGMEEEIAEMFTHILWRAPAVKAMQMQSRQTSNVFLYERTFVPASSEVRNARAGPNDNKFSAFQDIQLLFGSTDQYGARTNVLTEEEKVVSDALVKMWSNFVKFSHPTPFQESKIPNWEPFEERDEKYMDISTTLEMKEKPSQSEMYFWQQVNFDRHDKYFSSNGLHLAGGRPAPGFPTSSFPYPLAAPFHPTKVFQQQPAATIPTRTGASNIRHQNTGARNIYAPYPNPYHNNFNYMFT